ncbi:MAG: hypothetical protein ACP59X_05275 [Solidesulfovibrio sp. DCME]|uniref:hypothetical protein n=1 Tax=Solidesulfovibrio sp. DCME TaxID=3447380 RepID=UPI003D11E2FC
MRAVLLGAWCGLLSLYVLAGWAVAGERALAGAARQAYGAGDFAGAAEAFAQAFAAAPQQAGPAFCLDAALAARMAGQPGWAAFWLRQAALAGPGDPETVAALAAAGLDAGALFAGPWFLAGWLPAWLLWLAALGANACFWLALAAGRVWGRRLPRPSVLAAGAAVAVLWLAVGWASLAGRLWPRGVVLAEATLASAPEAGAEPLGGLAAGQLVAIGRERAGRLLVRTGDGRVGWLFRDRIATLRP